MNDVYDWFAIIKGKGFVTRDSVTTTEIMNDDLPIVAFGIFRRKTGTRFWYQNSSGRFYKDAVLLETPGISGEKRPKWAVRKVGAFPHLPEESEVPDRYILGYQMMLEESESEKSVALIVNLDGSWNLECKGVES